MLFRLFMIISFLLPWQRSAKSQTARKTSSLLSLGACGHCSASWETFSRNSTSVLATSSINLWVLGPELVAILLLSGIWAWLRCFLYRIILFRGLKPSAMLSHSASISAMFLSLTSSRSNVDNLNSFGRRSAAILLTRSVPTCSILVFAKTPEVKNCYCSLSGFKTKNNNYVAWPPRAESSIEHYKKWHFRNISLPTLGGRGRNEFFASGEPQCLLTADCCSIYTVDSLL